MKQKDDTRRRRLPPTSSAIALCAVHRGTGKEKTTITRRSVIHHLVHRSLAAASLCRLYAPALRWTMEVGSSRAQSSRTCIVVNAFSLFGLPPTHRRLSSAFAVLPRLFHPRIWDRSYFQSRSPGFPTPT